MSDTTETARQYASTSDEDLTQIIQALRTYAKRELGLGSHVPHLMGEAADALARLRDEHAKLLGFVRAVIACRHDDGIDGFDLQDMAVSHGILTPETYAKPCCDKCACASFYGKDEFPTTCYRLAEFVRAP